jgi:cysteine-rich repeat protein
VNDILATTRLRTRSLLRNQCGSFDAAVLSFGSTIEMQSDASALCTEVETSVISASYLPVAGDASSDPVDEAVAMCVRAGAGAAVRLLRFTLRVWRQTFDRMAVRPLSLSEKEDRVARAERRIQRAREKLVASVETTCPATAFVAAYGREADEFLRGIAERGRCYVGDTYVQAAVTCPDPVCGNGMRESGEDCDDGNDDDADSCSTTCRKNPG